MTSLLPLAAQLGVGVADPLRVAELEASLEEAREEGARNAGSLRDAEAEVKSLTEQLQAKEEEADRVAATAEKQRRKADALRLILAAQVRETTRFMLEASAAAAEREDPSSAELREGLDHLMGVTGSAQKEAARVFEEHVRRHSGGEGEGEGEDDLDDEEDGKDPRWASPSVQEALRVERGLHDVARALHEAQSKVRFPPPLTGTAQVGFGHHDRRPLCINPPPPPPPPCLAAAGFEPPGPLVGPRGAEGGP